MKLGTLCYIEKNNQYLMLHRTKKKKDIHKNLWVGLGGKFEPGESPEACVIREVYEESGLAIINPKLKGIMMFPAFAGDDDWYVFLFTVTEFSGEIKPCAEGELTWVDKDKLDDLAMHEGDYYFTKWMQADAGIFSAIFNYENNKLIDYHIANYN